ncbi:MAG: hypothetical protein HN793_02485 [Rhodospirillaceae bacterium]|jgi:hypothetical protein|nr:hypothetical protein [Rhodospirillaceae bacterium]MBT5239345.1 hypothetical protein [Rhodospirillaceae bacterium]MBT5566363.1 hypothetical protein [Rhodospirillaceae bacterium]MBT6088456.1 hypothetical protein [Rhodospirillaceae bacterium]MBT7449671.1 hypothetical protein [Rhodospirillaceae bacterium]
MSQREALKSELLDLIETHKEGFASGTPESQRINALIDEMVEETPYPSALNHTDVFKGHWAGNYYNFGRLVGGDGAQDQGVGVSASLNVFSMGRLPDVPATFVSSGLEIDPDAGQYNFYTRLKVGEAQIDTHHFTYGRYIKKDENLDRFFVEFDSFEIMAMDPDMSAEDYCKAIGIDSPEELTATLSPSPKLYSHVAYMDDDMRIQLGQLGGHYIMFRTDQPMYSVEHAKGNRINPPAIAAE